MEEPLIIRRDEQMFRMGLIAFAVSLPVFIFLIVLVGKSQTNIWECELADMRMGDIAVDSLLLIVCLIVSISVMAIVQSYESRYKLDENGITEKYNSPLHALKSWQECAYLGVKCNGYPTIMCVRNMGGSVLEIFYTPKVWDELSQYMSRHDVKILAPEIKYPWQKIRPDKKIRQTECILRDIQEKLEINEIEAMAERKWIVDKNGIEVITTADKKKNFYKWQDMTRVGVCGEFSENPNLRIFFSVKGNQRKNKIQFTEKRYEEFLKYVPEGKETDPMTNDFRIRLLRTQSYWRMYYEH